MSSPTITNKPYVVRKNRFCIVVVVAVVVTVVVAVVDVVGDPTSE